MLFTSPRTADIGPVRRLACLADVHGNYAALDAVLRSAQFASADAVAVLGCTTPGPEPAAVLARLAQLTVPCLQLAGNGERAVIELADGHGDDTWAVGPWIVEQHSPRWLEEIRGWPQMLVADVHGLGQVRLVHGSPRSDIEVLTPKTPAQRIIEATADIDERIVVHGHTHLQYDRSVAGRRILGCGSVGQPYTSAGFGAQWTLLADEVQQLRTPYDLDEARRRVQACGYPSPRFIETLERPPTPAEIIADAEPRVFAD